MNDCLPQYVCVECCGQLNQCSDFFERTNQAQLDLRQMLLEPDDKIKEDPQIITETELQPSVNYIHNTSELILCKEEGLIESSEIEQLVDDNSEQLVKSEDNEIVEDVEDESKSFSKAAANKKKAKRKNSVEESEELQCHEIEKEESNDQEEEKTNVRVPDNYMTGRCCKIDKLFNSTEN